MAQGRTRRRHRKGLAALGTGAGLRAVLGTGGIVVIHIIGKVMGTHRIHRQGSVHQSIVLVVREQFTQLHQISTVVIHGAAESQNHRIGGNIGGMVIKACPPHGCLGPVCFQPTDGYAQTGRNRCRVGNIGHSLRNHQIKLHGTDVASLNGDGVLHHISDLNIGGRRRHMNDHGSICGQNAHRQQGQQHCQTQQTAQDTFA